MQFFWHLYMGEGVWKLSRWNLRKICILSNEPQRASCGLHRDVYRYLNSIRYLLLIPCFDTWYESLILISSKHQEKQVIVLWIGLPELRPNVREIRVNCVMVRPLGNGAQNQFWVEWVHFFGKKHQAMVFLILCLSKPPPEPMHCCPKNNTFVLNFLPTAESISVLLTNQ